MVPALLRNMPSGLPILLNFVELAHQEKGLSGNTAVVTRLDQLLELFGHLKAFLNFPLLHQANAICTQNDRLQMR